MDVCIKVDKQIQNYLPLLGVKEKKSLLYTIKSFMELKENTQRISIEQYNKEIADSEARIDAGNYFTQEEVEALIK